jgi:hypothetical protein
MPFIKIEDVIVPSKGVGKYFSIRAINIEIPGSGAAFYWEVLTEQTEPHESDEQPVKSPGKSILSGNLDMAPVDYAEWGSDDHYVINWALQQLGFTKL